MAAGSTYTPIQTIPVTNASTGTITFSSISGYTDLVLVVTGGCDAGGFALRFNSDTASNYSMTYLAGNTTAVSSNRQSSQTRIDAGGIVGGQNINSNTIISIPNYSNTTTFKNIISRTNTASSEVVFIVGLYRSTSAITSVSAIAINGTGLFINGSGATLYGIASA
jgi:hypothetical protein